MKTAMKKLLSLMLVAVLLVSAVPFQASAAAQGTVTVSLKNGDTVVGDAQTITVNKIPTTVNKLLDNNRINLSGTEGNLIKVWDNNAHAEITADTELNDGASIILQYAGSGDSGNGNGQDQDSNGEVQPITMKLLFNDDTAVSQTLTHTPSNGVSSTIIDLLSYVYDASWSDKYEFVRANNSRLGTVTNINSEVLAGESINVRLKAKAQEVKPISLVVKVESSDNVVWTGSKEPANGTSAKVEDLLSYCWNKEWDDVYKFDHAWSHEQQKNVALSGSVNAGDTLYIMVNKLNNSNSGSNNSGSNNSGSNSSGSDKLNSNKVYLHIFLNNKVDEPAKNVDITNGIALDGKVTLAEVKTVVKNYYTSKNSDGIGYDGLYFATGNWVGNFVRDDKVETIDNIAELKKDGYVHINIMITNANAKSSSSSTADPSNPKTGDSITMTMTVMTISASALALVYFFNKKRAIVK